MKVIQMLHLNRSGQTSSKTYDNKEDKNALNHHNRLQKKNNILLFQAYIQRVKHTKFILHMNAS